MASHTPFRKRFSMSERCEQCARVRVRHPEHVPAILERLDARTAPPRKERFLLSPDLDGARLLHVVRSHVDVEASEALYVLCGGVLLTASMSVRDVAHLCDTDGFLYLVYALENAFG